MTAPAGAQSRPIVSGSGSTWSQIAVDQWAADVSRFGVRINYQGTGSSAGRTNYLQGQTDFAVSEIPFEGASETNAPRAKISAYLPIVAGGTSFMYNLRSGSGSPITTLRLSSTTVTKIFTGGITKWNDPEIAGENPGLGLPDKPIIPVVRSDGSGTSAQFSAYMAKQEQSIWCAFAQKQGLGCGHTSNYPVFPGAVGQQGSDGVANYVHSESTGQGAITYVEAGYAIQRGRPVAFLKNGSGNYTLPTSSNVSKALERAKLNPDDTQNLDEVYVSPDADAYALSSYSYMIVPTAELDEAKGAVLGDFMEYFACEGQRKADQLGYAPLPKNLVEVVFSAIRRVPGASEPMPIAECTNPTISGGSGGPSDDTAEALSGGASSTGTAPATPGADAGGGSTTADGTMPGGSTSAGTTGGTTGGGSTSGGSGGVAVSAGSAVGGSTSGGSAAGSATGGAITSGGVNGALGADALQAIGLGGGDTTLDGGEGSGETAAASSSSAGAAGQPSNTPLTAAGLAVALLVFMPPILSGFRARRADMVGRLEAIDRRLKMLVEETTAARYAYDREA